MSSTPWFTPLGVSSVATPDQVKGSDFCRPGEANSARQNVALPSWPLLPFRLVDSKRTGCASGDQKRAGPSIFCSANRPVSVCTAGWSSLLPVVFLGSESQPRHMTARASTAFKPAFFRNVILADVIRVTPILDGAGAGMDVRKGMYPAGYPWLLALGYSPWVTRPGLLAEVTRWEALPCAPV